ncbi:response regulator [Scytonema sp. UIC 10036]|uniref:response regulator n=1 Tax=Scytonema sp. UIC 10036 TaxID=2304196 RepID=UPI0012DA342D|nr:response regulator [Scytonema sp. UIC 10036]MUG94266.1 response regulator [Scytonema sp. UIC 10036]
MDRQPLVLVVEQNLHYLELLNSYCKILKLPCICAKQGIKALILAQTHQPDLILLDPDLADLSGFQVIHYLKHNERTMPIPILGMITSIREQDGNSLLFAGADRYISKPFHLHELKVAINCYFTHLKFSNSL